MSHVPLSQVSHTRDRGTRGTAKRKEMYQLEKYRGRATRHECPRCGDKQSFTYYVDEFGNIIDKAVGRCNHESGCGYHYTPKEYFADHPNEQQELQRNTPTIIKKKELCTIPFDYVEKSASYKSSFVEFLCGIFPIATIEQLAEDYALGATRDEAVIYWQIDHKGRVRTGKVMHYNPDTGHRIKEYNVNWIHSLMKKSQQLPEEWELTQCLFGEHLLNLERNRDKVVAVVESEKSAIIGSGCNPNFVWLATGGKSQLSVEKMRVLAGRTVVMFPDVDGYAEWVEKAKAFTFCKVVVSDILEKNATEEQRIAKIDIADLLVAKRETAPTVEAMKQELTDADKMRLMREKNPVFGMLCDRLNLVPL